MILSPQPVPALDVVLSAEAFIRFITPEVVGEAHFTQECNEYRRLADYLADLETRIQRLLAGEVAWLADVTAEDLTREGRD